MLEVSSCHSDTKSYEDTNSNVWCASCKQALRVKLWNTYVCSAFTGVDPVMTKTENSAVKCAYGLFCLLLEYYNTCVIVTDKYNKQMAYIQKSTWAIQLCQWLGKSSKSLETFLCESSKSTSENIYIGRFKPEGGNSLETSSVFFSVATFVFVWSLWAHLFDAMLSQVA